MPAMRAVAYFRMSDAKQEASIPEQERWAARAAIQHGAEVIRTFRDDGIPGDEITDRGGLQDLLDFCRQRHKAGSPIEAVIVWDADRFSRANSFATAAVLDGLMNHGVRKMLTNAEGMIDFEDDMQRVFFNLRQDLGKRAYSQSVSAAVSRTRAERAAAGLWTGGPVPFGYILGADSHLALGDPEHVEVVRRVFREYLARDIGAYALADELQAAGCPFPTYRGRTVWTDDLVRQILTDPQYTGDLYHNRTRAGKYNRTTAGGRVVKYKPAVVRKGKARAAVNAAEDYIVCPDAHPVIIDRATFEAVQRKLHSRRAYKGKPSVGRSSDYPLSGLARCGECGSAMYGITVVKKHGGKRYTWRKYACSRYMQSGGGDCHYNTVREDALLDRVADVLEERFREPALADVREEVLARRHQQDKSAEKAGRQLQRRMAALDAQIAQGNKNLALAKKAKDFERVSTAISGWEAEREELARELESLSQAAQADRQDEEGLDDALVLLQQLGAVFRKALPEEKRDVLKGLVEKVELRFEHRVLPSGRTRSRCVGGDIHLRGDLGCSPMPGEGTPTW